MDPLSVAASIIAVVGAASSIGKAISKLKILSDASGELCALHNEISDIQMVFRTASDLIEIEGDRIPPTHAEGLISLSQRAKSKLLEIESLIPYQLNNSQGSDSGTQAKVARLKWLVGRHRVQSLQEELRSLRSTFAAKLAAIATLEISSAKLLIDEINIGAVQNQKNSERGHEEITDILKDHRHLLETIFEHLTHMPSPKKITMATGDHSASTDMAFAPALRTDLKAADSSTLEVRGSYLSDSPCGAPCSCACHSTSSTKTPLCLREALGSLFLGYTSIPLLVPNCTEPLCRRRLRTSVTLSYFFPSWFCSRRILAKMSFSGTAGPELLLRVPHVVAPNSDIFLYSMNGNITGLQRLFRTGLASPHDTDAVGHTPLHFAVHRDLVETCKFLIKAGSDVQIGDAENVKPMDTAWNLILSKRASNLEAFQEMFADNADCDYINSKQFSGVHKAILGLGCIPLSKLPGILQLSPTVEINARDSMGMTGLAWAAEMNDTAAIKLLLEYGANPNIADVRGRTPLMRTIDPACLKLLLDAGADISARDRIQQTALLFATQSARCTEFLLDYGAYSNYVEATAGLTPIHFCVQNNRSDALRVLLERGADYTQLAHDGSSVVHSALRWADSTTLGVLTQACLKGIDLDAQDSCGTTGFSLAEIRQTESPKLSEAISNFVTSLQPESVIMRQATTVTAMDPVSN